MAAASFCAPTVPVPSSPVPPLLLVELPPPSPTMHSGHRKFTCLTVLPGSCSMIGTHPVFGSKACSLFELPLVTVALQPSVQPSLVPLEMVRFRPTL